MVHDQIKLSSTTAEGIGLALGQDFNRVETPERMAWVALQLEYVPDVQKWFPKGKWATIQSIQEQLRACAEGA